MLLSFAVAFLAEQEGGIVVARSGEILVQAYGFLEVFLGQLKFTGALVHQGESLVDLRVGIVYFHGLREIALGGIPIALADILASELNAPLQGLLR